MKKINAAFFLLFLVSSLQSQTGWMWQNPDPQGNELKGVSMVGTHWAVGAKGTVIHRVHPGDYWEIVDIGTTEGLNDIDIFSISKQGWIVGNNGTIFYTDDNGANWVQQNSGTTENLHSVSAVMDACVWACGDNGTILKSLYDDGTWEIINTPVQLNYYGIDSYHCNEAWAVGEDGLIISTEDGGQTWTSHHAGTSWDLFSVDMHDNTTSRACGNSGIIISKDWNEENWQKENDALAYRLNGIVTSLGQSGYAVGSDGTILRGTDGGSTWVQKETGIPWELNDIDKISLEDYTYQVVGQYGIMLKNDGYDSEFEITNDFFWHWIQSIEFVNKDIGWAVGGDPGWGGTTDGIILHTTNGGGTWEVQKNLQTALNDMDFVDENKGYAVGRDGLIKITYNGGVNWGTQTSPIDGFLTSVCFTDENNGWIVSRDNWGEIIHTSNGGTTWTPQTNPSGNPLHDVFFIDENNGWAVGLDSSVIRTSNGGATWEWFNVNASQGYRFASVYFVNEMLGWIAGIYGSILRTIDGGNNWQEVESGTSESLNDIFFIDTERGWAVGDAGTILHSTDGGATWFNQVSGVATNFLTSICFISTQRGWVAGEGGSILYTNHGGSNLANTIHVDIQNNSGTEDGSIEYPYNTVAEGIDAAIAGDSVIIHPGEYLESPLTELDIKDGLIIVGEDSATTVIAIPFYTGELTMKYYTEISGLTCPGYSAANGNGTATLKIKGCHIGELSFSSESGYTFIVEDCTIEGFVSNTSGMSYLTIRNNHFLDGGINDSGQAPEGIEAHIIEGNVINMYGTKGPNNAAIEANSTSITIKNNTISIHGEGSGIVLSTGSPTNIIGNIINLNDGNVIDQTAGIKTSAGSGVVTGNTITGGHVGYISSSGATLFENNTITKAHTGFYSNGAEKVQNNLINDCRGHGLIANGLAGPIQNNTIIENDSAGIVIHYPVDMGGGDKDGEGRNIFQNNGYYDMVVSYQPLEPDTIHARYNLWDHGSMDEILANDVLNEGGANLVLDLKGFITFPAIPDLISPANNSTNVNLNPEISWLQTAIPDYYRIQIAYDESFAGLVIDTTEIKDTTFLITLEHSTSYYWRVKAENPAGSSEWSEIWQFATGVTGIENKEKSGFDFHIYPNPAKDQLIIRLIMINSAVGKIELFNSSGKKVMDKQIPAGTESFELDIRPLKSGVYFCKISIQDHSLTKKIILQK